MQIYLILIPKFLFKMTSNSETIHVFSFLTFLILLQKKKKKKKLKQFKFQYIMNIYTIIISKINKEWICILLLCNFSSKKQNSILLFAFSLSVFEKKGGQFASFVLHLLIPQSITSLKVAPNVWKFS